MTSRNIINFVLLLLVAILIAILLFEKPETIQTRFKLTQLTESEIDNIEITRLTAEAIKFKKLNSIWYMVSPYHIPANSFFIESLLRITQAKSNSKFKISTHDKTKFKLAPAQASLKLNQHLLLFGGNEQLNLMRYILINDHVYLIPDRFFYILNSTVTGFMDHALLEKNAIITGFSLSNIELSLIKNQWRATPHRENISADDVTLLINEWHNAQAIEILKLNIKLLSNNNQKIKIYLKDNDHPIQYQVVTTDQEILLLREDLKIQYKFSIDIAETLLEFNFN